MNKKDNSQKKANKDGKGFVTVTLRVSGPLHSRLTRIAEIEKRSLNAQVVYMLEEISLHVEKDLRERGKLTEDN
jgi:hypothetical protein